MPDWLIEISMMMMVGFLKLRSTSATGTRSAFLPATLALKTGDSSTFRRTYSPTKTTARLPMNGTRQPQDSISSVGRCATQATAAAAGSTPPNIPVVAKALHVPRHLAEVLSETSTGAAVVSPPYATPWRKRRTVKQIGAQIPMDS